MTFPGFPWQPWYILIFPLLIPVLKWILKKLCCWWCINSPYHILALLHFKPGNVWKAKKTNNIFFTFTEIIQCCKKCCSWVAPGIAVSKWQESSKNCSNTVKIIFLSFFFKFCVDDFFPCLSTRWIYSFPMESTFS